MDDFIYLDTEEARRLTGRPVYNRWDDPDYTEAEDVPFEVAYEDQTGPAWDVWALTYPHREADAREYLVHERTHNDVYWYRDTRDQREYGMPSVELVEAYNEILVERQHRADRRTLAKKRIFAATGMFLVLVFILGPVIPAAAPWLIVSSPVFFLLVSKFYGRDPKLSYAKIAEVRFDEFTSNQERHDRMIRIIANVLTIGMIGGWLYWRHHRN